MTTTVVLAWVEFAGQPAELFTASATDGTAKNLTTNEGGVELGDFAGQSIQRVTVQAGDGSTLNTVQLVDAAGGQLAQWIGVKRTPGSGTTYGSWNMKSQRVALKVERGMTLKALTAN